MVGFCRRAEKLTPITETPLEKDLPCCSAFLQTPSVPGQCGGTAPEARAHHVVTSPGSIALRYRLALGAGR